MQLRACDGLTIDHFAARIAGTIDIEDEDIDDFGMGDTLVLALVVTVDGAALKRLPNGDLRRVNTLQPVAMRVAGGELRDSLMHCLGVESTPMLREVV